MQILKSPRSIFWILISYWCLLLLLLMLPLVVPGTEKHGLEVNHSGGTNAPLVAFHLLSGKVVLVLTCLQLLLFFLMDDRDYVKLLSCLSGLAVLGLMYFAARWRQQLLRGVMSLLGLEPWNTVPKDLFLYTPVFYLLPVAAVFQFVLALIIPDRHCSLAASDHRRMVADACDPHDSQAPLRSRESKRRGRSATREGERSNSRRQKVERRIAREYSRIDAMQIPGSVILTSVLAALGAVGILARAMTAGSRMEMLLVSAFAVTTLVGAMVPLMTFRPLRKFHARRNALKEAYESDFTSEEADELRRLYWRQFPLVLLTITAPIAMIWLRRSVKQSVERNPFLQNEQRLVYRASQAVFGLLLLIIGLPLTFAAIHSFSTAPRTTQTDQRKAAVSEHSATDLDALYVQLLSGWKEHLGTDKVAHTEWEEASIFNSYCGRRIVPLTPDGSGIDKSLLKFLPHDRIAFSPKQADAVLSAEFEDVKREYTDGKKVVIPTARIRLYDIHQRTMIYRSIPIVGDASARKRWGADAVAAAPKLGHTISRILGFPEKPVPFAVKQSEPIALSRYFSGDVQEASLIRLEQLLHANIRRRTDADEGLGLMQSGFGGAVNELWAAPGRLSLLERIFRSEGRPNVPYDNIHEFAVVNPAVDNGASDDAVVVIRLINPNSTHMLLEDLNTVGFQGRSSTYRRIDTRRTHNGQEYHLTVDQERIGPDELNGHAVFFPDPQTIVFGREQSVVNVMNCVRRETLNVDSLDRLGMTERFDLPTIVSFANSNAHIVDVCTGKKLQQRLIAIAEHNGIDDTELAPLLPFPQMVDSLTVEYRLDRESPVTLHVRKRNDRLPGDLPTWLQKERQPRAGVGAVSLTLEERLNRVFATNPQRKPDSWDLSAKQTALLAASFRGHGAATAGSLGTTSDVGGYESGELSGTPNGSTWFAPPYWPYQTSLETTIASLSDFFRNPTPVETQTMRGGRIPHQLLNEDMEGVPQQAARNAELNDEERFELLERLSERVSPSLLSYAAELLNTNEQLKSGGLWLSELNRPALHRSPVVVLNTNATTLRRKQDVANLAYVVGSAYDTFDPSGDLAIHSAGVFPSICQGVGTSEFAHPEVSLSPYGNSSGHEKVGMVMAETLEMSGTLAPTGYAAQMFCYNKTDAEIGRLASANGYDVAIVVDSKVDSRRKNRRITLRLLDVDQVAPVLSLRLSDRDVESFQNGTSENRSVRRFTERLQRTLKSQPLSSPDAKLDQAYLKNIPVPDNPGDRLRIAWVLRVLYAQDIVDRELLKAQFTRLFGRKLDGVPFFDASTRQHADFAIRFSHASESMESDR